MNKNLIKNDGKIKYRILATKNIRIELKNAFPDVKFSVTSRCFANGNAIDIRWEDGPDNLEVKKIVDKYQEGHFDLYEDYYKDEPTEFKETYGYAKYVQCYRRRAK